MFKILVVEDDRDLNRTVCAFLNASGYQATGCLDANDAYDAMYAQVFDLIVSDIMMPGIDGFEFAKTVRSLNENIPILFMTARDDLAAKQRGYRIGVDDYMVKPIDLDELFLRIGALLRRAKIAQGMEKKARKTGKKPLMTTFSVYNLARNNVFDYSKAQRELGYTTRPYQQTIHDKVRWMIEEGLIEK